MLAAELGHDAMLTLLAKNRANFKILDAEGKGERAQAQRALQADGDSSSTVERNGEIQLQSKQRHSTECALITFTAKTNWSRLDWVAAHKVTFPGKPHDINAIM